MLSGRGTLQVVDTDHEVKAGSIVSVDHGEDHRFINVAEDLQILVVFAPPDPPTPDRPTGVSAAGSWSVRRAASSRSIPRRWRGARLCCSPGRVGLTPAPLPQRSGSRGSRW